MKIYRPEYEGKYETNKEYNVVAFVKEPQTALTAAWDMTITPLDTCRIVKLTGQRYKKVLGSDEPLARTVIENYRIWAKNRSLDPAAVDRGSSILFNTVAIYLAISTESVKMEKLRIRITDDGYTVIDEGRQED